MSLGAAAAALIPGFVCLDQYIFRFQSTTRGISRVLKGRVDRELQLALSPAWVGFLGWLQKALGISIATMLWVGWGWVAAAAFMLYWFVLGAFTDAVSPLPTYEHCLKVILRELRTSGQPGEFVGAVERIEQNVLRKQPRSRR